MSQLSLGRSIAFDGTGGMRPLGLPPHHLVTHAAILGMTGSGKTGLVFVLVEEALRNGIPVLMVDLKGDLPNLLLSFPMGRAAPFLPWIDAGAPQHQGRSPEEVVSELVRERDAGLAKFGISPDQVEAWRAGVRVRVLTPGSSAGEPVHLLSSLERRSPLWDSDLEGARDALSSAISLVLRLVGRDADPARSKDHVLLSVLAERRLRAGGPADLGTLLRDVEAPPIEEVGAMQVDEFLSKANRRELASALNTLLAAPSVATWREGASVDVGAWLAPGDGRTPAVVLSVAHLDDDERALVLGMEVYGYLPPHPANPPTKRPLVSLLKQARAYGVGVVLATQNPMDLDYRALSNAGLWFVGRLQTDADRTRVVEGMAAAPGEGAGPSRAALAARIKGLGKRWFVMRNVHAREATVLMQPRDTITWMRGPMTRVEIRAALHGTSG